MGRNSKIEWTQHTFNPWWGCEKVSPACTHCYAEAWAKRVGQDLWGEGSQRRFFSDAHWKQPLVWNAEATRTGTRARVFCASMADVFEERDDLNEARQRLWELIGATDHLDWLVLTKRPHAVPALAPWTDEWPGNIWLGTTVENQRMAAKRIPSLLATNAKRRFLSCEPLLGRIDLSRFSVADRLHWVIAGGESGGQARPSHPDWFRGLRDQCQYFGIEFHFKQWGNWVPTDHESASNGKRTQRVGINGSTMNMVRVAKKDAGRDLDGRQWDGVPASVGGA